MPGGTKRAARKYDFPARKYEMTGDCFPDVNYLSNLLFSICIALKQPGGPTTLYTPDLQERQLIRGFASKCFSFSDKT